MTYFPDKTPIVNHFNIYDESKKLPRDLHNLVLKFASVDRKFHLSEYVPILLALKSDRKDELALGLFKSHVSTLISSSLKPIYVSNLISTLRGACFMYFLEQIKHQKDLFAKKPELLAHTLSNMPTLSLWMMKTYEQPELNECRCIFRKIGIDFPKLFDGELSARGINLAYIGTKESLRELQSITEKEFKNS